MTDTNQKLREALQAISDIDDSTNHAVDASAALDRIGQIARQALALPTDEQVGDINVVESFTSVTKTAAPAQEPAPTWSLREALQKAKDALSLALSDVDWRKDSPTQPVIHKAYNCAHQALALPTADHIPDAGGMVADHLPEAGKMIETAAPVGEREAFENEMRHVDVWGHRSLKKRASGNYENWQVNLMWDVWQARAALSAGDAADAQRYRWLMDNCTLGIKQNGVGWSLNTTACIAPDCIKDVGATIDAAMRKGQL